VKRFLKPSAIGLAVLLFGFAVFLTVEHFRGRSALASRLNELRAVGEKLAVSELTPPRSDRGQNAFTDLLALTNELKALSSALSNPPSQMKYVAPGRAAASWQMERWRDPEGRTNHWNSLQLEFEKGERVLASLHTALQVPEFDSGFDYNKGFDDFAMPPILPVKTAAQLLSAGTSCNLHQKRYRESLGCLQALLTLIERMRNEKLIITQLVRRACMLIALNATWEVLEAEGTTEPQLAALQKSWESFDLASDMARSFEMERNMTIAYFTKLQDSAEARERAFDTKAQLADLFSEEHPKEPGFVLRYLHAPLWRFAWADQDHLRALNRWQLMIENDRLARSNSWLAAKPAFDKIEAASPTTSVLGVFDVENERLGWYDRCRYLFSSDPFAVTVSLELKVLKSEALQQMAIAAIALKRFQLNAGQTADDLQALIPDYLVRLPRDPIDGKPLRYRRHTDGSFLLYSIGDNAQDDGGDPVVESSSSDSPSMWNGRDIVWPHLASPEEVAALLEKPGKAVR
jgi:hypothetical protein